VNGIICTYYDIVDFNLRGIFMTSNTLPSKATSRFDSLPIAVQMIIGIAILLLIAAAGFAVFFAIDILLLDFDPIGKLASAIFGK
jgi:hypothetical protein